MFHLLQVFLSLKVVGVATVKMSPCSTNPVKNTSDVSSANNDVELKGDHSVGQFYNTELVDGEDDESASDEDEVDNPTDINDATDIDDP